MPVCWASCFWRAPSSGFGCTAIGVYCQTNGHWPDNTSPGALRMPRAAAPSYRRRRNATAYGSVPPCGDGLDSPAPPLASDQAACEAQLLLGLERLTAVVLVVRPDADLLRAGPVVVGGKDR